MNELIHGKGMGVWGCSVLLFVEKAEYWGGCESYVSSNNIEQSWQERLNLGFLSTGQAAPLGLHAVGTKEAAREAAASDPGRLLRDAKSLGQAAWK